MRIAARVVLVCLSAALLVHAPARADQAGGVPKTVTAVLNGLEIGIDAQTGSIVHLAYPGPGALLDTSGQAASLVELICPVKGSRSLRLGSRYSRDVKITKTDDQVVIRWDKLGADRAFAGAVSATVTLKAAPDGRSVIMDCAIENRSDHVPQQILFPDLSGLVRLAGPSPTEFRTGGRVTMPFGDPRPTDPGHVDTRNRTVARFDCRYGIAGAMVIRWMDYGSLSGGLSLFPRRWGFDPQTTVLLFLPDRNKKVRLASEHRTTLARGATWRSGEYWLTPHESGWAKGIEPYRAWAKQNVKRRWPLPEHIRKGLGFRSLWMSQLQPRDPEDAVWKFSDLKRVARESKEHGLYEITLWQTRDGFELPLPPAYEHLGGDRELVKAVADCKRLGVNVAPMVSVVQVTARTAARYGVTKLHNEFTYHTEFVPRLSPGYVTRYTCGSVDTRNPIWGKEVLASCKHWIDIGVPSIFWDQFFIEPPEPNLLTVTREIRDYARKRDPESTFSGELVHDFEVAADYLDFTWNWGMPTRDVQPVISVFPAPRANFNIGDSAADVKLCFVRNQFMNVQPRRPDGINGSDWIENHPELSRALKQCAKLRAQFLTYFVDGTLIGDCILSEPAPGTILCAYVLPDRVLIVVLNTTGETKPIDLSLNLPPWLASLSGRYRAKSYDGDGKPVETIELDKSNPRLTTPALDNLGLFLFVLRACQKITW